MATRNLALLGALLLAGFILPVIVPGPRGVTEAYFVNMEVLEAPRAPALAKFLCFYPALAGLAAIAFAFVRSDLGRGIGLLSFGVVPLLAFVAEATKEVGFDPRMVVFLLPAVALAVMLGGSRGLYYRSHSRAPLVVAAAAAAAFLLSQLLPVLPAKAGTIQLLLPFAFLRREGFMAACPLVAEGAAVAASVLCFAALMRYRSSEDAPRAVNGFIIAGAFTALTVVFVASVGADGGPDVVAAFFIGLKIACWGGGLLLLLSAGVTSLLMHLIPRAPATEPAAPSRRSPGGIPARRERRSRR